MAQQTAVEWLIEQMKNGNFESWHTKNKWNTSYHAQENTLEIAKQMEKEQLEQLCIEVAEEAKKIFKEELKEFIVLPKI